MSGPTAEQLSRVGDWIRREAAAKSVDDIHSWVAERQEQLVLSAESIPAAGLQTPAAPGEWSPIDALKHVVEWNWQVGEDVLHVCLTGERPGNAHPDFEPDVESLVVRQREGLESVWAHVSAADPGAFLDVRWEHPFFGMLNWREWFLFLGVHCTDHANQIRGASSAGA